MEIKSIQSCMSEQSGVVVFPLYKGMDACHTVMDKLGYDFKEESNQEYGVISKVTTFGKTEASHVYILSLGEKEEITEQKLLEAFGKLVKTLNEEHISIALPKAVTDSITLSQVATLASEAIVCANYSFTKIGHGEDVNNTIYELKGKEITEAILDGRLRGEAINHTRTLGNTPSNFMNPLHLADYATALSKKYNLGIELFDNQALKDMGAGGILGVNLGSDIEARLIVLKYEGAGKDAPYTALVGKGITYDTGGYNLKPGPSMSGMKFDMCGSATVLGAIELIASRKEKVNVYCVVPTTENKINGLAYVDGDVLTSLSGKTVEIKNTDAEGRLVLMDGLTFAQRNLKAKRVVDVATLTGACVMALGDVYTGAFSNSEDFYNKLVSSANTTNEKIWRLPLDEQFTKAMCKSDVADMINSAPRTVGAGASTAACFLQEFVEDGTEWIHLDIAGTGDKAENDLGPKGATGVMVKTLAELVK